MRKQCAIGIVSVIISLFLQVSCQREIVYNPLLLGIEEMVAEHPDSALNLLSGISPSYLPESSRALYDLLMTEAKDKTYASHTSDSVIRSVVHYFDETSDVSRRAKAWFYWGRVSEDMFRSEKSIGMLPQSFAAGGRKEKL